MTDTSDDRALVERFARRRDEASFRLLYRRHTPALYGLALRLLAHRRDDAEDVIQEAWIRAVEQAARFRWDSSLRTWLSGIVVNCCRERLRNDWRWVGDDAAGSEEQAAAASPVDLTIDVDRSVAELPPGSRAVFVLHDVEGWTHAEIASQLGIEPGTSKSQLFHARRQLRALLNRRRMTL